MDMKRKKKLTARQRKLAAMYGDKNKITRRDRDWETTFYCSLYA